MTAEIFSITADRPNQETLPLMAVARESDVKNVGMREQNLLSLSYGEIVRKDINSADGLLPASFETYQIVEPGMTVLRFTDLQNDQRSLRSGLVTERGIITSAYVAVDPFAMNPQFFAYLMRAYDTNKVFYGMGGGVRQGLNFESIRRLPVPLLPADEQRAIADYLDQETAQIDALVAKQEEFIELLRERRDAAWASGLERAIGERPPIPLRRAITSIVDGPFGSSLTSAHYSDSGTRVIRLGNIGINSFRAQDKAYIPDSYAEQLAGHNVLPGDVVIAGLGDETWPLGRAAVVPDIGPAIVKADCFRARPAPGVSGSYLAWALSAPQTRSQVALLARGSTRQRINTSIARTIGIPVPSPEHQKSILRDSEDELSRVDALIAKAEEHIALAKERRSALITAAVTGQFDVRTARKAG